MNLEICRMVNGSNWINEFEFEYLDTVSEVIELTGSVEFISFRTRLTMFDNDFRSIQHYADFITYVIIFEVLYNHGILELKKEGKIAFLGYRFLIELEADPLLPGVVVDGKDYRVNPSGWDTLKWDILKQMVSDVCHVSELCTHFKLFIMSGTRRFSIESFDQLFYRVRLFLKTLTAIIKVEIQHDASSFLTEQNMITSTFHEYISIMGIHSISINDEDMGMRLAGKSYSRVESAEILISVSGQLVELTSRLNDIQDIIIESRKPVPRSKQVDLMPGVRTWKLPTNQLKNCEVNSKPPLHPENVSTKNIPENGPLNDTQKTILKGLVYYYDNNFDATCKLLNEHLENHHNFVNAKQTVSNNITILKRLGYVENPYLRKPKYIRLTEKGRNLFPLSS